MTFLAMHVLEKENMSTLYTNVSAKKVRKISGSGSCQNS